MGLHQIVMLAYRGCQLLDVTGPMQMFAAANDEAAAPLYRLQIAAPEAGPLPTSSGVVLNADLAFDAIGRTRLARVGTILVAGGDAGLRAARQDGRLVALLGRAAGVPRMGSICSGVFFLAAAGFLDGRRAATHWRAVSALKRFHPAVEVDADAIFVRDGKFWTSAGVTAGIDMALAMIEADHGRDLALSVARDMVVLPKRPGGQSQFSDALFLSDHGDTRLERLARKVASAPHADWRNPALADEAGLSLRSLTRLFRRELQSGPAEFVERVRVDQARRALLETNAQIEAIARRCGFGTLRRMDRAFARTIAATPSEFRARFKVKGRSA